MTSYLCALNWLRNAIHQAPRELLLCYRWLKRGTQTRNQEAERAKHKGKSVEQQFPMYPSHEISSNRDEILKLTERVELLHQHCSDTVSQVRKKISFRMETTLFCKPLWMVSKVNYVILLSEGKHSIKRQLYSGPFILREAASFIFQH